MFFKGLLFLFGIIICTRLPGLPSIWFACALPLLVWLGWKYRCCRYPCWALGGFSGPC